MVGHYEGNRDWRKLNAVSEIAARGAMGVDLDLKADGAFLLKEFGIPYEGTWNAGSDSLDLHVETVAGKPLERQPEAMQKYASFSVKVKDGAIVFTSPANGDEILLQKKPKP